MNSTTDFLKRRRNPAMPITLCFGLLVHFFVIEKGHLAQSEKMEEEKDNEEIICTDASFDPGGGRVRRLRTGGGQDRDWYDYGYGRSRRPIVQ
jgi:hypothetical protein